MDFEWDDEKNQANYRKHRVWFEEAKTAFIDEEAIVYDDPDHSADEERFILLGLSTALRVLVVVHCIRGGGETIRIISARKAKRLEREAYAGEEP
jgi:uncharacterized DUF497 family protein